MIDLELLISEGYFSTQYACNTIYVIQCIQYSVKEIADLSLKTDMHVMWVCMHALINTPNAYRLLSLKMENRLEVN